MIAAGPAAASAAPSAGKPRHRGASGRGGVLGCATLPLAAAAAHALALLVVLALRRLVVVLPSAADLPKTAASAAATSARLPPLAHGRSFVALSADDFGRFSDSVPLQPDATFMRTHPALALRTRPDWTPWYARATVETRTDLQNLAQFLENLNKNVSFEQRAVLTPHWVVGGPDFDAMRSAGCRPHSASLLQEVHEQRQPHRQQADLAPSAAATSVHVARPSVDKQHNIPINGTTAVDPQQGQPLPPKQPAPQDLPASVFQPTAAANEKAPANTSYSHVTRRVLPPPTAPATSSSCAYRERLLSDNAATGVDQSPYNRGDLRDDYLDLWKRGLWHPEYHGRSHFNIKHWLALLRTDPAAQRCFDANMVCASSPELLRSEFTGFSSSADLKIWLEGGVNAFASFFGYRPNVMSSPHNAWSGQLADAVVDLGITAGELAEDQEAYVPHSPRLSLHDRYRFDIFFPGFECDRAIAEVVKMLHVPARKSVIDRWYEFLSFIDLFRTHYRPYHHSPGGNHERFMSLMWHAQNTMSSTYSEAERFSHMQCLQKVVSTVRRQLPRTVFVTGSELHQIRSRGWSQEIWQDSVIVRNYGDREVQIVVPDLRDRYWKSPSWRGRPIVVETLSVDTPLYNSRDANNLLPSRVASARSDVVHVSCGETLIVPADAVIRLQALPLRAHEQTQPSP